VCFVKNPENKVFTIDRLLKLNTRVRLRRSQCHCGQARIDVVASKQSVPGPFDFMALPGEAWVVSPVGQSRSPVRKYIDRKIFSPSGGQRLLSGTRGGGPTANHCRALGITKEIREADVEHFSRAQHHSTAAPFLPRLPTTRPFTTVPFRDHARDQRGHDDSWLEAPGSSLTCLALSHSV
jgi:hypothetical protein